MPGNIVIIDNEPYIIKLLELNLNREGYKTFAAEKGVKGLELALRVQPALIIVELALPDLDGLSVCKHLRTYKKTRSVPIIVLSGKSDEAERVLSLETFADDFVVKPFFPRELVARVGAILRRYCTRVSNDEAGKEIPELIENGEIRMDLRQRLVTVGGKEKKLTVKEFELLRIFLSNPGRAITREYLLESIWGYEYRSDTRTVDVHVRRLRKRIENDPADPRYIETLRRVGYRFRNSRNGRAKYER